MLDATQSVDMISSLRNNYGRVEVAVLNVDLLPNSTDTVVIRDRLYSPIYVQGQDENKGNDTNMHMDEGNDGADHNKEQGAMLES
jgi:hypothetical protein